MHFDSFDNQISAKLSFTVQTFKKQNSMDMEKYNGLMIDVHYLVRQPPKKIMEMWLLILLTITPLYNM